MSTSAMPDIRVNLVPREIARKARARRQRGIAAAGAVVVLALLGAGVVLQDQRVATAGDELETEQAALAELEAEARSLTEFATLEVERQVLDDTIAVALGRQVEVAGVLQDVAAVMPPDAALLNLSISTTVQREGAVGAVQATGQSTDGHAPGLERLLVSFDKVDAFDELYFGSSTATEDGVIDFDFDFVLNTEVLSERYLDGVPEDLR